MDAFVNEKDFALLARDPYTFAVLDRILRGPCELIRSDHQRLILCHSEAPYPVWLWTPDGLSDAEKERAWDLAAALRPFSAGYRFNMKYELAEYCIERSRQAGPPVGVSPRESPRLSSGLFSSWTDMGVSMTTRWESHEPMRLMTGMSL